MTALLGLLALGAGGCQRPTFTWRARAGLTVYCHGAGNLDFAHRSIRDGLLAAGHRGQVYSYVWTMSFVPPVDQVVRPWVEKRAEGLARLIETYQQRYPGRPVNLIGLSAGSGVVVWALEKLPPGHGVDNVVLLSSSLSADYDLRPALAHVKGKLYNFYWPGDPLLGNIVKKGFFTVDGRFRAQSAGLVGFRQADERVENIHWEPLEKTLANYRGHTDCTRAEFVRDEIAPLLTSASRAARRTDAATPTGSDSPDVGSARSPRPAGHRATGE